MKKYDLLATGGVYIDINSTGMSFGDEGLRIEREIVGSDYEMTLGGSALNFNRICANLGLSNVMIGKVGDDLPGHLLEKLIGEAKVHPALVRSANVKTNVSMNFVNDKGQAVMTTAGTANQALTAAEVLERARPLLTEVKYLYLSSCIKLKRLLPAYEELAEAATSTDTQIVVDHGRLNAKTTKEDCAMVKDLVQHASFYFPSRDEFLELWEFETVEAAFQGRDWGKTRVIVKDGANGAHVCSDGKAFHLPAFAAEPINTVGAGDSFNAGVIAAVNGSAGLEDAVRFGCATAALKISRLGLPSRAEVEALVATAAK